MMPVVVLTYRVCCIAARITSKKIIYYAGDAFNISAVKGFVQL